MVFGLQEEMWETILGERRDVLATLKFLEIDPQHTTDMARAAKLETVNEARLPWPDIGGSDGDGEFNDATLIAALCAHPDVPGSVISDLIGRGVDGSTSTAQGSPLHITARMNDHAKVKAIVQSYTEPAEREALLSARHDEDMDDEKRGASPLMTAIWSLADPCLIETLIDAGSDVCSRSTHGFTPLMVLRSVHARPRALANPCLLPLISTPLATLPSRFPAPLCFPVNGCFRREIRTYLRQTY